MLQAFTHIYKENVWQDPETVSGGGSTLAFTEKVRNQLPEIMKELGVGSFLDAGCGDWNWMSKIDFGEITVLACDIVPELIQANRQKHLDVFFYTADFTVDPLPHVDLILCRAVLFHLSLANINLALDNMKRTCKYLLLTSHPHVTENVDIRDGDFRRLNLELLLGPADMKFQDGPGDDGVLALWKLS